MKMLFACILLLGSAPLVRADLVILTADNITTSIGGASITSPTNAYGLFNDTAASTTANWGTTGQVITLGIQNFTVNGTILNVTFAFRMNASGTITNDQLQIQYSNDSTTWVDAQASITPTTSLTTYGNYSVLAYFNTVARLNNMAVRLRYTRNPPTDNYRSGVDGVEVYVTYAPPPTVILFTPANATWTRATTVEFNFTAQTLLAIDNCSIYLNGVFNQSNQTPITLTANNSINVSTLAEDDYLWNLTCRDTGGWNGTAPASFLLSVDRTPPLVTLVAPPQHNLTAFFLNNFTFNVTDRAVVRNCSIIIDGIVANTTLSTQNVSKGVNASLMATLMQGQHNWSVNCTDHAGNTGASGERNITVEVTAPLVQTDAGSYILGDTVNYSGINWNVGTNVTLAILLPNGSLQATNYSVNSSGGFNTTRWLNYTYPTGQYNITAYQTDDLSINDTTTFTVSARVVSIAPDMAEHIQGDEVPLTGVGFHPSSTVNVTIVFPTGRNETFIATNANGGFLFTYYTNTTAPIGQYNVSAIDLAYPLLNATTAFNISLRVTRMTTNASRYGYNASVLVNGIAFSAFGDVLVQLYNTVTTRLATGFPTSHTASSVGNFNFTWSAGDTCSGNYTVLGEDQNVTTYRANTTFLIWHNQSQLLTRLPLTVNANQVTPNVANVNVSDDTPQNIGLTAAILDGYLEFQFLSSVPRNATFTNVVFLMEHSRTTNKVNNYQMYLVNGSALVTLTGCSGTPPDVDGNATCDITSYITNNTLANDIRIRVNYTRSGGGGGDANIDYARVNISWLGDVYGCKEFGDTPEAPNITSMSAPSGNVVLNAGTTRVVQCNATVFDRNGATDITGANATFYISPSTSGSALTNVSKYENASCALVSSDANNKFFRCTAALLYYASNGTWSCNITGISADGIGSRNASFMVDPLYAINVTDTLLNFGTVSPGFASANITENLTNVGNQRLNVSVYGYGLTPGDNASFSCANNVNLSIDLLRFGINNSVVYGEKRNISMVVQDMGLRIFAQTSPDPLPARNTTYWQMSVPTTYSAVTTCNGTIVFQAEFGG
jgi:hypothetical protein